MSSETSHLPPAEHAQRPGASPVSLPPVSVVIPTLNCESNLRECLRRLSLLSYPKNLIEILVMDGGSQDGTGAATREWGAHFHSMPQYKTNQEARRGAGLALAKNEFVLFLDSDNFIPHNQPHWLRDMLAPLQDDPALIGSQTLHWTYGPNSSLLTKYFTLVGAGDPVALALGKADKVPLDEEGWNLLGRPADQGDYLVVEFEPEIHKVPTLGCNPFLGRKSMLKKAQSSPGQFFHTDVLMDLIGQGHARMAFCKKASLIHESNYGLGDFVSRRFRYSLAYSPDEGSRRYYVLTARDYPKLARYILTSLTFVVPALRACRGYLKIREPAWFLHPLICFLFLFIYTPLALRLLAAYFARFIPKTRAGARPPPAA